MLNHMAKEWIHEAIKMLQGMCTFWVQTTGFKLTLYLMAYAYVSPFQNIFSNFLTVEDKRVILLVQLL